MWTKKFWLDALERAVKTGAQVLIGSFTGLTAVDELDWTAVGITTGVAVALSVLTSIVSSQVGSPSDASLVTTKGGGK